MWKLQSQLNLLLQKNNHSKPDALLLKKLENYYSPTRSKLSENIKFSIILRSRCWTSFEARTPQNGQTHSKQFVGCCWRLKLETCWKNSIGDKLHEKMLRNWWINLTCWTFVNYRATQICNLFTFDIRMHG